MREEASAMGAGLFIGEYGGDSSAYWAYDKNDVGYGLLHDDGSEKKELADVLTRPYPQRVAGKVLSYAK